MNAVRLVRRDERADERDEHDERVSTSADAPRPVRAPAADVQPLVAPNR